MTLIAQHACCSLLGIDPKTLRRWLALTQISWLPDPTDARRRCLTPAHLQYLAAIHQRPLTAPLAEDVQPPVPHPAGDPSTPHIDDASSSSSISELREQVSQLQTTITTLQQQLTQLTPLICLTNGCSVQSLLSPQHPLLSLHHQPRKRASPPHKRNPPILGKDDRVNWFPSLNTPPQAPLSSCLHSMANSASSQSRGNGLPGLAHSPPSVLLANRAA
ncbi:MAG TPA: hypothetical protein VFV38_01505 [Ktedonobacteraceae bacterium]|nr:hypothetical protein [Ktedonobacteraceae bacterium]